jgi:hypothetical protein
LTKEANRYLIGAGKWLGIIFLCTENAGQSYGRCTSFEGYKIKVASLKNIIRSKKALGRPRDNAVIDILVKKLS